MLSNEGQNNLQLLRNLAINYWGDNLQIIGIDIHEKAPFDIFEINILIYGKFHVLLEYEIGTFGISVKVDNGLVILSKFTEKEIVRGFDSLVPKNIEHNFKVLDEELKLRLGKN